MGNKSFKKILGVWDGVLTSVQQLLRKTYLYMDGPLLNQTFNNHSVYVYKLFAEIMILHNLLGSTKSDVFECPECTMEFKTKLDISTHLSIIHGEDFNGKHDILLTFNENAYQGRFM